MKLQININEEALTDLVSQMIAKQILSDKLCYETKEAKIGIRIGVEKGIKEYIYSKKDEIIEKVVEKASTEIVKKGLPKLLEKLSNE